MREVKGGGKEMKLKRITISIIAQVLLEAVMFGRGGGLMDGVQRSELKAVCDIIASPIF